jgi:16S rRNA processing protein RimM
MSNNYIKIGLIAKPHGLNGEVTILIDEQIPVDFESVENIFVHHQNQYVPYFIESLSLKGNKAYLKLEDVDSLNDAEDLAKCVIYIPKDLRPELGPDNFYDDEIIGFGVTDTQAGNLGQVTDVLPSGLQRLIQIKKADKEVLIPINAPFIIKIDKSAKMLTVELPDGFLDL